MSLDNFRNRTIIWDTVNKDFPQPIQIMQGDVNARTLLIKIVDNGTEIDLTGHSLKLTYQYTNSSNSGFVMIPPKDLAKGEFILVIPTEMTTTGVIEANLILLNESLEQVIVSKNLTFISDNSTVTDLAQEVNNKIDDFTKLLLENMPQVMRSELNDLRAQTDSNKSNIELKANLADMTSLQSALTDLKNEVEAFGISPENLVTIKSLLDAIASNASESEVVELINSVNVLTSNISLMSNGDYSPKANQTDLESLQHTVNDHSATISTKANQTDLNNLQATVDKQDIAISMLDNKVSTISSGAPKAVSQVSSMTDKTKNYVYTGTESGYTSGNWYYWSGTAWTSGGTYQSAGIADNSVSTAKLQEGAVTSSKTNFLKNDLTENLFDGNYIEGFAVIGPDKNGIMSYIERKGSKVAKIPIIPNTKYRVRREVPSRFTYATSTIERPVGTNFDGSLQKNNSGSGKSQTPREIEFTSGPNDKFLYVNMSSDYTEPFLRVSFNKLPAKETFRYSVKPNTKIDVLTKSEFDNAIFGADKISFVEKENLFDGKYIKNVKLQGSEPYILMNSENAQTAEIKVEPNTTYYWGRNTSSRMNWGTATEQLSVGKSLDGSIRQNMSGNGTTSEPEIYSFTTGPDDQYLYINNSLNNENKYLIVTKNKLTAVEEKDYDIVIPSKNFDVITSKNINKFVHIANKKRNMMLKYDGKNNLQIYVPSRKTNLYVRYLYTKVVDSSINMNQWRVLTTTICNEDLSTRYELDAQTEWEGAIKEKGATDFIGGNHGDERNIDTSLLVDGKEVVLTNIPFTMDAYDEIKTVNHSILNRANTPSVDMLKRTKVNVWKSDCYSVENFYTCLKDFQIEQSKLTLMSCRYIDSMSNKTLIGKGRRDIDYVTNIISRDGVGDLNTRTKDTHLMEFWGDELYLSAECIVDNNKYDNRNQYVENFGSDYVPRAKMYFDITGLYFIKKDEVLHNKSLYKILV